MSLMEPDNSQSKADLWYKIRENGTTVLIALALAFVIRVFIAEPRYIPSESMSPTLETGDRLVIEKVAYKFHDPDNGDIIVFHPPKKLRILGYESNQAFIKRAIAKAGETVAVKNGIVYVNNQPLAENYIEAPPEYDYPEIIVPKGKLFVMGDNRNNSNDSHIWGFLPTENVIGHAVFRFWPLERIGTV
ncbi:MAG: signal peptidase I [Cyanobacteria bacterium P01_G01_bin.67]